MDRFEIRNYGPNTGLMFGSVWMNFWKGSKAQFTDDPELAEAAGQLPYVEVVDREPETLESLSVKELAKKAISLGLSGLSRKPKAEIIEAIKLAEAELAPAVEV